jgi:rubrerythrin
MKKLSKDIENLIKEAIKLEINGKAFFNHAAEATSSELGKKMFRRLADEEVKHLETFGGLFSSILKSDDWKRFVEREQLKEKSRVIDELVSRLSHAEGKSEVEAISIGMELEQKAVEFFQRSSESTDDPQAKVIFEKICDEERFHYDLLQAQYDSVTGSGFWLDSSEFQMDGRY